MPIFIDAKRVHITPEHAAEIQAEGRRIVRITPVFVSEPLTHPAHIHHDKGVTTVWEATRVATDGTSVWPLRDRQFRNDYVERAHTDQFRDELLRFLLWVQGARDTEPYQAATAMVGGDDLGPVAFQALIEIYLTREGA